MHPWNRQVIEEERKLRTDYGLHNKREILIAASRLKKFRDISKKLIAEHTAQAEKERAQLFHKLQRYGFLKAGAVIDDVLSLKLTDILERRIQSLVYRKGLARSMKQARQFIVHRHIRLGAKEITSPGKILTLEEESVLTFHPGSTIAKEDHPERVNIAREAERAAAEAAAKKAKKEENIEDEVIVPMEEAEE